MTLESAPMVRISPTLTERQERVLKAVNAVPFMSVQEIRRWPLSGASVSSARALVRDIAEDVGAEDGNNNGYLYYASLPTRGNWLRLYTISSRGAKYLRKIGVQVTWWGKGYKLRNYSISYLRHQHAVAKLLVALHCFCRENRAYEVAEALTSQDLIRQPPCATVHADGQEAKVAVLPDAWVYVERVADGQGSALWFEIDNNGNEYRTRFQQLARARLALIKNGFYADYFGTTCVLLCYLVTGATSFTQRITRLRTIRRWIQEVLAQEKLEDWASVFRFAMVEDFSTSPLFDAPIWHCADDSDDQVPLLDPVTPTTQHAAVADKEKSDGELS